MRLHRVWWSKRQPQHPLGLFTHLSLNRVDMLERQCRSYPGGLVVGAVWIPLVRHLDDPPDRQTGPADGAAGKHTQEKGQQRNPDRASGGARRRVCAVQRLGYIRGGRGLFESGEAATAVKKPAPDEGDPRVIVEEDEEGFRTAAGGDRLGSSYQQHQHRHRSHHRGHHHANLPAVQWSALHKAAALLSLLFHRMEAPDALAGDSAAMMADWNFTDTDKRGHGHGLGEDHGGAAAAGVFGADDDGDADMAAGSAGGEPGGGGSAGSAAGHSMTTCVLRILLLYELVADEQLAVLMPVNALRNTAMLAVDTPLAAMVDSDLVPSESLARHVLADPARSADLQRRAEVDRVGWVMPAWDVDKRLPDEERRQVADTLAELHAAAKPVLSVMWRKNRIHPFAIERYPSGHNGTQSARWLTEKDEYPIAFQEGYEPWFLAYRKYLPLYDARFRGHYYDKIANVRNVVRNKVLNLVVIPDVWLAHRPHGLSAQNNLYALAARGSGMVSPLDLPLLINGTTVEPRRRYVEAVGAMYKDAAHEMNMGRYVPVVQEAVLNCRRVLPWWQGQSAAAGPAPGSTPTNRTAEDGKRGPQGG